jgi:hypothetical protein
VPIRVILWAADTHQACGTKTLDRLEAVRSRARAPKIYALDKAVAGCADQREQRWHRDRTSSYEFADAAAICLCDENFINSTLNAKQKRETFSSNEYANRLDTAADQHFHYTVSELRSFKYAEEYLAAIITHRLMKPLTSIAEALGDHTCIR